VNRVLISVVAAALVVGGLLEASRVPDASLRHQAYVMVLVLTAVAAAARLPRLLGAAADRTAAWLRAGGIAVVAADVFGSIEGMRGQPHPDSIEPAVSIVWTVMLAVQLLVIMAVTARRVRVSPAALGAGGLAGVSVFALWALLCLMQPDIPQSNAPTVLALGLAAMAAVQWSLLRRARPAHSAAAGLLAAATVAVLSGDLIDVGLPHLSRWIASSAPPAATFGPHAPHRLVDPVGILMLGTLVAIALLCTVLVVIARTDRGGGEPGAAPA
jgi:hypothetical protein